MAHARLAAHETSTLAVRTLDSVRRVLVVLGLLLAVGFGSERATYAQEAQEAQDVAGGVLPATRIVAYYGNPLSPILGVLGEAAVDETVARLQAQADAYAELDPERPVQPALELIAVLAQAGPGPDGAYRARMPAEMIDELVRVADANGYLLILDVQPGHAAILDEVEYLRPWLGLPNVHLALDPEFTMRGGQAPGQGIGTLDADTINTAIDLLAGEVEAQGLPPKVLIVHRFLETMVTNFGSIRPDPRVQVVIDMDGFGSPTAKLSKYAALVRDQPVQFAGIKLFYKHDAPVLSPSDVVNLDPSPDVVIYQ
jgi:hypothetical protein